MRGMSLRTSISGNVAETHRLGISEMQPLCETMDTHGS